MVQLYKRRHMLRQTAIELVMKVQWDETDWSVMRLNVV
jgi:hypothetical protein